MNTTSPEDVLAALQDDFRRRGLSQSDVARLTGYKTRQAIGTILAAGKYLLPSQALRFESAFHYNVSFLTAGIGTLGGIMPSDPYAKLLSCDLPDFDDVNSFDEKFRFMMRTLIDVYGLENIETFLRQCVQYIGILSRSGSAFKSLSRTFFSGWKIDKPESSEEFEDYVERLTAIHLANMYGTYKRGLAHRDAVYVEKVH